jgi:hypothetical protein
MIVNYILWILLMGMIIYFIWRGYPIYKSGRNPNNMKELDENEKQIVKRIRFLMLLVFFILFVYNIFFPSS